MKKIRNTLYSCLAATVLLFGAMCANVGYAYANAVCAMKHYGTSAPPSVAFLIAIPYSFAIAILVVVCILLYKKYKRASR